MGIGFMIAGGVSVLFAAILCAFPAQVLYLITDNLTLVELAEPYLRIVGFSYIFNSLSSIYIGMQRSIENPRFGMIVFAISMLCNTLGNYVLIFGKLGLPALGMQRSIENPRFGCGGSDASVPRGGVRRRVLLRVPLPHDAAHEARHPPPRHGHAA